MFIRKISFKLLYIPLKFIVTLFSSFYNPYDKNRALVLFWTSDPWGIILSGRIAISQLKKKNPDLKVLVVAKRKDKTFLQSPQIKNIFGFNIEDKILSQTESLKIIFKKFDVVIVPSITSFSFTDHILAGLT